MRDSIQTTNKILYSKNVKAALREETHPITEREIGVFINQARNGNFGLASPKTKELSQKAFESGIGSIVGVYKPADPGLENVVIYYDTTVKDDPAIWVLFYNEFIGQLKGSWFSGADFEAPTKTIERGTRMGQSPEFMYNQFQLHERQSSAKGSGIYTAYEQARAGYKSDVAVRNFLENPAGTRGQAAKFAAQEAERLGITVEEYKENLKKKWHDQIKKTIDHYRQLDADWIRDLSDEEATFKIANVIVSKKGQSQANYETIFRILFGPNGDDFRGFERHLITDSCSGTGHKISWCVEVKDNNNSDIFVTDSYKEAEKLFDDFIPSKIQKVKLSRLSDEDSIDIKSKSGANTATFKVITNTKLPIKIRRAIYDLIDTFNNKAVKFDKINDYIDKLNIGANILSMDDEYILTIENYPDYKLSIRYV